MNMYIYLLILLICAMPFYAQDCKTRGNRCADHEQCCGGCCFDGECVDTYRSCLTDLNVCREHACVGGENCVSFVPPQCPGCEPIPLCRVLL